MITESKIKKSLSLLTFFIIFSPKLYSASFIVGTTAIDVRVFKTLKEQEVGLGGIKAKDFSTKMAALFLYKDNRKRQFWMLNTYFNLDIFFLDKDYKILDIERNMLFHPGNKNLKEVSRTRYIHSQHILEMRADSPFSKKLKINSKLNWKKRPSP